EVVPVPAEYASPPHFSPAPARDSGMPAERRSRWSAGAAGGLLMGISPEPMALGAAFVDLEAALGFARDFSIRAALIGAWGSGDTAVGPVNRTLVAGRGEACPFRWGAAAWGLRPCVSMELGATTASSERQTKELGAGLWVAPGLGLRGTVDIADP